MVYIYLAACIVMLELSKIVGENNAIEISKLYFSDCISFIISLLTYKLYKINITIRT